MITISALAHSTSSIPSRETSNNIGWYASANVSSNSDSDSEEGYTKPYTDPLLVQRNMVWKVLSDGAINTVGRVCEDKDVATCHYTEEQSEEDLPQDNESAVYVDFIDDAEKMKQPHERFLQDNESAVYVDCINDVVSATQTDKGVLSDGAINEVGRVYEDKDVATYHYTEKQSEEDLPQDNESAVYVDFINDVVSATQTGKGVLSDGAINKVGRVYEDKDVATCHYTEKQSEEDLPQDNESAVYVDCINDVVSATQTGKGVLSDGAINKVGRVYEDKDVATCRYTEKQSEEDLPQDNESAVYVDFINDVVSATQTGKGLLSDGAINNVESVYEDKDVATCHYTEKQSEEDLPQDNESAVYVDFINDVVSATQTGKGLLSDGAINKVGRVYQDKDVATCHYTEKQSEEDLPQDNESAVYVDFINDVVSATQTGKGVLSDGAIDKVGRVYEDKDVATCRFTEKQSEGDLPQDNESAVYVDFINDVVSATQTGKGLLSDGAINNVGRVYEDKDVATCHYTEKQSEEDLPQDNESAVYVDFINDVVSATQTGKGVLSDGAINKVGRVYEDKDVATCRYTEKQSEEDLPQDSESAVYVDFIDDAERMKQPYEKLLQDNESAVYVDCINDVVSATQTGKGVLQGGESALYVDLISDAESAMLSDEALPKVNESAARVS